MVNLAKIGIPEDFSGKTWESFKDIKDYLDEDETIDYRKVLKVAKNWEKAIIEKSSVLGLFLYGHNGSGKTTIACLLLLTFKKQGRDVLRITMTKLQQDFYEEWRIPEIALFRGVLFIDEVGKEYKTKQEHSEILLEYVLKYRAERRLVTILASNSDIKYLNQRYGATVNSILKGKFLPLAFPEVDLRQRTVGDEINKIIGED